MRAEVVRVCWQLYDLMLKISGQRRCHPFLQELSLITAHGAKPRLACELTASLGWVVHAGSDMLPGFHPPRPTVFGQRIDRYSSTTIFHEIRDAS